jgi:hypothetical protein
MEFFENANVDKIVERTIEIMFGITVICWIGKQLWNLIRDSD